MTLGPLMIDLAGPELTADHLETVRTAVTLYTGDLLEGWYWEWCQDERQRLQTMYLILVDKLVSYCESRQLYDMGIIYAGHILRLDRAHERTHRRLMRMHYLGGDRTAALRQYQRCRAALGDELGIRPSARTEALYARMTANDATLAPGAEPALPDDDAPLLASVMEHLQQLQALVGNLQHQVQDHIATTDRPLRPIR